MTAGEQNRPTEQQALELLPWYVNGTLTDVERELVRRELLFSLTCRKEFERLRRLQQAMQREDGESAATERAFERLLTRIGEGTESRPPRLLSGQAITWSVFARAAVLLAFVSGLVWWAFPAPPTAPQNFGTLSSPQSVDANLSRLRVVFASGVSGTVLRDLLAEYQLTIVDGPTRDGLYTLSLADGADVQRVVAALKADSRIAFTSTPAAAGDR